MVTLLLIVVAFPCLRQCLRHTFLFCRNLCRARYFKLKVDLTLAVAPRVCTLNNVCSNHTFALRLSVAAYVPVLGDCRVFSGIVGTKIRLLVPGRDTLLPTRGMTQHIVLYPTQKVHDEHKHPDFRDLDRGVH